MQEKPSCGNVSVELSGTACSINMVWCSVQSMNGISLSPKNVIICDNLYVELVRVLLLCDLPRGL